jgi:hypothetical protein
MLIMLILLYTVFERAYVHFLIVKLIIEPLKFILNPFASLRIHRGRIGHPTAFRAG